MNNKPTYEELEQRIQTLERDLAEREGVEKSLQESEEMFRTLFEQAEEPHKNTYEELQKIIKEKDLTEKLHTLTFENNPDCIFVKDAEFRIVLANQNFINMYPKEKQDKIIGYTTLEDYRPGEVDLFLELDKKAFSDGFSETIETINFPSGICRVLHTKKIRFEGNNNEQYILGICHDITERKQAQEALLRQQAFLEAILENIEEGIVACDEHGMLSVFNRATRDFHGIKEKQLPPEQWASYYSLYLADGKTPMQTEDIPLFRAFQDGSVKKVEMVIAPKEGKTRAVLASGNAMFDANGEKIGAVVSMQDITERKQAQQNERQHLLELAHVSRLSTMGEMATVIAHELNQPLTTIASYGDTLSRLKKSGLWETEDVDNALQAITQQAHRAADVLHHLRDFVQNKLSEWQPININDLIQDVIQLTNVEIRWNNIAIQKDLAPSPPDVSGDKILIEQVILNLVRNAIDVMSNEQCSERNLLIKSQRRGKNEIKVSITDTGLGMSPEALTKVFEPFYTTKQKGMGMGLAISQSIIETHGGKLWATSKLGQSTTFYFTLPLGDKRKE